MLLTSILSNDIIYEPTSAFSAIINLIFIHNSLFTTHYSSAQPVHVTADAGINQFYDLSYDDHIITDYEIGDHYFIKFGFRDIVSNPFINDIALKFEKHSGGIMYSPNVFCDNILISKQSWIFN